MMGAEWSHLLRRLTAQEGGLIEVVVTAAAYEDWVAAVRGLSTASYAMSMKRYDTEVPVAVAREMFTDGEEIAYTLYVHVGQQLWTTQFYSTSLIDFQGDPNQISAETDIADLLHFVQVISNATGKDVRLVPETLDYENEREYLRVSPSVAES